MNNKNKVLKILDKHRDMSLTMGCEVELDRGGTGTYLWDVEDNIIAYRLHNKRTSHIYSKTRKCPKDGITVLGHPATPLTLLKALDDRGTEKYQYSMSPTGEIEKWHYNNKEFGEGYQVEKITTIPDVTTLTELPHTHKLWTDLLPILS